MVYTTMIQIYKYEDSIEKELKYIEDTEWVTDATNGNFKTKDLFNKT